MNRQVVIKKYENRRLYDTTHSRYINLEEVAQTVKEGHDVRVVDAATGEDLTRVVLTQIIMENAKESESAFPLDVLRQMVVASGRATQENTLKYIVGIMLTAFGWFWFGEGIGIQWPYGDAAILGLMAVVYVTSALAVRSIRRVRALADANIEGRP